MSLDLAKSLLYSSRMLLLLPRADILVTNTFWMPVLAGRLQDRFGKIVVNVARMPKGQMWLYRRAARLAAVSRAVRDAIADQCPRVSDRARVIPNPVDTGVFRPPVKPREWSGVRTLLYTGRIHPEKGLHLLVEAFREVLKADPECRLRLVGPWRVGEGGGGESYMSKLKGMSDGLPVEFCGPVYDLSGLAEELRRAHVYCYPSLAEKGESFGIAPLEAMATGLVPVVSDLACFRDFVDNGKNGVVFDHRSPNAVGELSGALLELTREPCRTARMGLAAAARAAGFGYEGVADMYLEDFRALLQGGL